MDYLVRGRYHLIPKHPEVLGPTELTALTEPDHRGQNPVSAQVQASGAAENGVAEMPVSSAQSGLKEISDAHE